jgi:hypothetical protein
VPHNKLIVVPLVFITSDISLVDLLHLLVPELLSFRGRRLQRPEF